MSEPGEDDYDTRIPLPEGFTAAHAGAIGNALVLSSSQFDTWETCRRKWWFRFWQKLPTPPNVALTFGTTLHAVCERWLGADDQGRDKDGNAVELYPNGWDAAITHIEAALIKKLVSEAIESGILTRQPGREVELDFLHFMEEISSLSVFVRGSIDLLVAPDLIEDHKTTKAMKWAKSPHKLATANQPLLYGYHLLSKLVEEGKPFPERIQVTHNYFVKDADNPRVKKVVAHHKGHDKPGVTPEMIETRWEQLKVVAREMVKLTRVANWKDTPDPPSFGQACNAYGGCPYRSICGGRETPEHYSKRLELASQEKEVMTGAANSILSKNLAAAKAGGPAVPPAGPVKVNGTVPPKPAAAPRPAPKAPPAPAKKKDERVFFVLDPTTGEPCEGEKSFDEIYAMINETKTDLTLNPSGTPDWKPASECGGFEVALMAIGKLDAVPDAPKPAAPPAATAPEGQRAAPWASEKCTACKLNPIRGFNSKGSVCRTCESHYGKVVQQAFKIETNAAGEISWTEIAPEALLVEQAPATEAPAAATETPTEPASDEPNGETTPGASGDAALANALQPAKRGRGRPAKGFTLLIGISCSKGFPTAVQLDDFMVSYGRELAKLSATPTNGIESYYDLDPFQRRDKLARVAEKIAKELGTAYVFVASQDPDTKALIAALRPYAGTVFEATR